MLKDLSASLKFYNKIDLPVRMRIIYNVKDCYAIRLKFEDNLSNEVSARSESQYQLYNQIKSTFILSYVFDICCHCDNLTCVYNKVCITKKHRSQ